MKAVILGAGVAGLAIGWRLAAAGVAVEVIERGLVGRGATWASAGMIAPGAELATEASPVAEFARASRAAWPAFAEAIEAASGEAVFYQERGSLLVAETAEQAGRLKERGLAKASGAALWLSFEELRAREPLLSPALAGALYDPRDAQVDNRALPIALAKALKRAGGTIREHCEAHALEVAGGRARALLTEQGVIEADVFILAGGAWMNRIGGLAPDELPAVRPVKGQMAAVEPPPGVALPEVLIWSDEAYLVPRHGRLWIGATVEDAGFDLSITREARDRLLRAATRLIPAIAEWRLAEMWAGLRPRTADNAPVLGALSISGLYVAGGQFRNGILFAPAIADGLARLVLGQQPAGALQAFDPCRFANS